MRDVVAVPPHTLCVVGVVCALCAQRRVPAFGCSTHERQPQGGRGPGGGERVHSDRLGG